MLELRPLRYFATVARVGTYAGAARELHLAEPGLWKQIRHLEQELGVALFERQGRGMHLTTAGEALLERVHDVLGAVERLEQTAGKLRGGQAGRVTIGCLATHVAQFVGPVLSHFQPAHPDVHVQLHEYALALWTDERSISGPFADLTSGTVDLLVWWRHPGGEEAVEGFPVYSARITAVLPPGDPASRAEGGVPVEALRDRPLLVGDQGIVWALLREACRVAGFEPRLVNSPNISWLTRNTLGQLGLGIPIVADDLLALAGGVPGTPILSRQRPLAFSFWLYWRRGVKVSAAVEDFIAQARSFVGMHPAAPLHVSGATQQSPL